MPLQNNSLLKDYRRLLRLYNSGAVFTAVDTETTGLSYERNSVIEIGAVRFDKTGILDTINFLIKQDTPIPSMITKLTGITDQMLEGGVALSHALRNFSEFSKETVIIGHNIKFDLNFLNTSYERCLLPQLKNKAIDTLGFSRWAYPKNSSHKLQFLAEQMKINVLSAHRAYDDARVCMELFLRILKDTEPLQKI